MHINCSQQVIFYPDGSADINLEDDIVYRAIYEVGNGLVTVRIHQGSFGQMTFALTEGGDILVDIANQNQWLLLEE